MPYLGRNLLLGFKNGQQYTPTPTAFFGIKARLASGQLENRNWKLENSKRKTPPFIPQERRDGAEMQNPQGWDTQRRFSELRPGHPPTRQLEGEATARMTPYTVSRPTSPSYLVPALPTQTTLQRSGLGMSSSRISSTT